MLILVPPSLKLSMYKVCVSISIHLIWHLHHLVLPNTFHFTSPLIDRTIPLFVFLVLECFFSEEKLLCVLVVGDLTESKIVEVPRKYVPGSSSKKENAYILIMIEKSTNQSIPPMACSVSFVSAYRR